MAEPLCPYNMYEAMRNLGPISKEDRVVPIAELIQKIDPLNQRVFVDIILFLKKVESRSEHNKMTK